MVTEVVTMMDVEAIITINIEKNMGTALENSHQISIWRTKCYTKRLHMAGNIDWHM